MGNCACCNSGPAPHSAENGNQKYKLLIIGPTFSGKTTFLKALQILYGGGFDEVSNDIYKDIMVRQIIHCVKTILDYITSEDEKIDAEFSYQSEITRDHSHLSVDDVSRHGLSYSGGSIGFIARTQASHLQRQNSKSVKSYSNNPNNNNNNGNGMGNEKTINIKKFDNPEIAPAAEYFLTTKFSHTSSYFEWLSNKKFIDNLNILWNDKQIQTIFLQNYYLSTKLPYSTKFFIDSIVSKLTEIHKELIANNGIPTGYNGTVNDTNVVTTGSSMVDDDEKQQNTHSKSHSRTTSLGRFNKQGSNNNTNDATLDSNFAQHPRGIDAMISVPMLQSQQQSGIMSGDGNNDNNNNNSDKPNENNSSDKPNNDKNKDNEKDNNKHDKHGKNSDKLTDNRDKKNNSKNKNSIALRYRPSNEEILFCYHRTINRNKEKITLQNKLTFEIWDVGGSKAEMKKWIFYCQRTNIVVFMVSLYQLSMLKYTLQLWESIINTKYETWFGTQRAMNELILMANESTNRRLSGGNNNGNNNNNGNGNNNGNNGTNNNGNNPNSNNNNNNNNNGQGGNNKGGYQHMYGNSQNTNGGTELAKLHSQSHETGTGNGSVTTGGVNGNGNNPNGATTTTTTVDIARIPCVLLLNGKERLAEMINKQNLNVKTNSACVQFFSAFNGDIKNVDAIADYVSLLFTKALKKKESRVQVSVFTVDCVNTESVKNAFDNIKELCVAAASKGR